MHDELNHGKSTWLHSGMRGKEKDIAAFVAYWSSMRKGHDVPRRTDIDPRGIESLLDSAFIAEKIAPGLARMRIAGSHLSDLMGMEVRGMPISSFVEPEQRQEFSDLLVDLFDRPAILKVDIESAAGVGRQTLKGTLIMLPMRSDLGDTSRALGCLVTNGAIGRTPRRFTITGHRVEPVSAPKPVAAEEKEDMAPGFAEPSLPFNATPIKHRSERSYLRVVPDSDDS